MRTTYVQALSSYFVEHPMNGRILALIYTIYKFKINIYFIHRVRCLSDYLIRHYMDQYL